MLGDQSNVYCIPTFHLSPNEIAARINEIIYSPEILKNGIVIAVDLKGGSTWNVACKQAGEKEHVAIIAGVNLPMLLSFLTKRESLKFDELVKSVVESGKRGIEKF